MRLQFLCYISSVGEHDQGCVQAITQMLLCRGALFLWIGVFLIAAIGYGTTDDPKFLGETGGDKRLY